MWGELVEHGGHGARGEPGQRQAGGKADAEEEKAVAQDHPEDLRTLRAEGKAHADFDGAAADTVSKRAVEADANQQGRERSEEDGEPSDQRGHEVAFLESRAEDLRFVERDVWIELAHGALNRGQKREGIAGGAQLDVHVADGVALGEVVPGHGHLLFVGACVFAVADDADDEGAIVFAADDVADGVGLGGIAFSEGLVNDGDERGAEGVGVAQVAAREERDAEGGEEAGRDPVAAEEVASVVPGVLVVVEEEQGVVGPAGAGAEFSYCGRIDAGERLEAR